MFEPCMLLAFLCAGLCHLLPSQPPAAPDKEGFRGLSEPATTKFSTLGRPHPRPPGPHSPINSGRPAWQRFQ